MPRVKRYRWVCSPRSRVMHMKFGNTSEGPARCGIHVPKGWWIIAGYNKQRRRCKRCCA